MSDYLSDLEDRNDRRSEVAAQNIALHLSESLKEKEADFFENMIKNIYIEWKNTSLAVYKTLLRILQEDEDVQGVDEYKKCTFSETKEDALSYYVDRLKNRFFVQCTDEEIDKIFALFVPFIQEKKISSEAQDILPEDIDRFVYTKLDFLSDEKLPKIQELLQKMVAKSKFPTRNESIYSDTYKNLQNESFNIFRRTDLSDQDQFDLLQIENDFKRMFFDPKTQKMKIPSDFISYFFASIIERDINTRPETLWLMEEMIEKYHISGNKETIKAYLLDCFERLKKIAIRKTN